jgi:hypothetical protein
MNARTLIASITAIITLSLSLSAAPSPEAKRTRVPTRNPKVIVAEKEPYQTNDGTVYTIFKLAITNIAEYPEELFVPTAKLPPSPCRGNDPNRLLWTIQKTDGDVLSCGAVKSRTDFRAIARVRRGDATPEVRLVLTDAKTGTTYTSSPLRLAQ